MRGTYLIMLPAGLVTSASFRTGGACEVPYLIMLPAGRVAGECCDRAAGAMVSHMAAQRVPLLHHPAPGLPLPPHSLRCHAIYSQATGELSQIGEVQRGRQLKIGTE